MLDTNSLKPLYIQLEAEIRQALREKKYLPGDRLPSEEKLCEQYQVSRITVRKAIQQLTDQHILEKHRGKGTFVSTPSRSSLLMIFYVKRFLFSLMNQFVTCSV